MIAYRSDILGVFRDRQRIISGKTISIAGGHQNMDTCIDGMYKVFQLLLFYEPWTVSGTIGEKWHGSGAGPNVLEL